MQKLELTVKDGGMRWFAHILWMDNGRMSKQAMHWEMDTTKRRPGRPEKNWIDSFDTIRQDLKETGMLCEEALECCVDRGDWHQCVVQCD